MKISEPSRTRTTDPAPHQSAKTRSKQLQFTRHLNQEMGMVQYIHRSRSVHFSSTGISETQYLCRPPNYDFFSQKLIRQLPEKFLRNLTLSYKVCCVPQVINKTLEIFSPPPLAKWYRHPRTACDLCVTRSLCSIRFSIGNPHYSTFACWHSGN